MAQAHFASAQEAAAALRRMTMAELRALLAIKSAGSISRAALALGVSQPALSQHVRDLELKLGVDLFVRHRRGLDATSFGSVLLRLADAMRVDMGIAAEELARAARDDQPPLRVGSMPVTTGGLLAVALSRFASEPANPSTVLFEGPRELMLEHLRHRRVDLFIGRLPAHSDSADLASETLFLDGAVVIASARHPLARRARLKMSDLRSHGWVMPAEDTSFHVQIAESMRRAGLALPPARIASYSMLAIPAIVSTSELLGFLPTSLFASGTLSGSLQRLPVDLDWTPSPVGVLMRRDVEAKGPLARLLEILRAVATSAQGAVGKR